MACHSFRQCNASRFRSVLVTLFVAVLCSGIGIAEASRKADGKFNRLMRWACKPRPGKGNEVEVEVAASGATVSKGRRLLGLCDRFRGGQLETGVDSQEEGSAQIDKLSKISDYTKSPYAFSLFQKSDGSDSDPDGIPNRYLKMQKDDRDKARTALDATLQWREEQDIDTILARPHPKFDICKQVFPAFFCGRDNSNHVVLIQRPGQINLPLAEVNELTADDLLHHHIWQMEYLWQILEPTADATMTAVIDLKGVGFSVLSKREILKVVQMFCTTMDAHFPQRGHKTVVINAPRWFGGMYKLISPLLREGTKEKVVIHSAGTKQEEFLRDLLPGCPPAEMCQSEDVVPSEMEQDLRNFCLARLKEAGVAMQHVVG